MRRSRDGVNVEGVADVVELLAEIEPRLRRALVSSYGAQLGSEATADALGWAWEHRARLASMSNPAGYLYRVGQTAVRRSTRARGRLGRSADAATAVSAVLQPDDSAPFEPGLAPALAELGTRQRTAVLLVHGYGYSLSEAAEVLGCRIRTLRNHLDRGLDKLRAELGAHDD